MTPKQLHDLFLEWWNDYLTVETFADHKGWSDTFAAAVIDEGRRIHELHAATGYRH